MQLSPFTQYYVRKILRQNLDRLRYFSNEGERLLNELDLNQVLGNLYPKEAEISAKQWELEALTQISQELEKNHGDPDNLVEIKRRILDILGFKIERATPSKLPVIVPEKLAHPFCFYREEKILEGVNHEGDFYGLVKEFDVSRRLQVYQLAWALSEKNVPLIVTTSQNRIGIWIRLRSPAYLVWLHQGAFLPGVVLSLHSTLYRFKETVSNSEQATTTLKHKSPE